MKKLLTFFTICLSVCCTAKSKPFPAPKLLLTQADYKELKVSYNSQGMAIYNDWMFCLHDKGSCAVFDLKKKTLAREFDVASAGANNHCNVAFFGTRRFKDGDAFPLLYISQANGTPVTEIGLPQTDTLSQLLFVERVMTDASGVPCGTEIVKLIQYEPATYVSRLWLQDPADPDHIYCYGNLYGNGKPGNRVAIKKFNYPDDGQFLTLLTDRDVIETTFVDEYLPKGFKGPQDNVLQGGKIRDGILYLPIGVGGVKRPAEIFIIDLRSRTRFGHILLSGAAERCEPEDIDIWRGKLVWSTNAWKDKTCPCFTLPLNNVLESMTDLDKESKDKEYSILILGDTHYDAPSADTYHSDYNETVEWLNRVQRQEFARNGEMWSSRCPKMVRRASRHNTPGTRMVFQMGDLIQGDCGNPEVHKKMLKDVLGMFKGMMGGLPFVTVTGNHDIRGTGAKAAYHEFMPGLMSSELGKEIKSTTFSFNIGKDLFIAIDFNSPDIEEIRRTLKNADDARYVFVISHGPLFPYDAANCRWFFLGKESKDSLRRELRKEFAERNVICLCGHTHYTELADWYGDGGRITQMTMNSVWSADNLATLDIKAEGAGSYGTRRGSMKRDDGKPIEDETPIFDEYRDGLKRYMQARGAGSYKMYVSDQGVRVDFYGGDSAEVTRTFVLR